MPISINLVDNGDTGLAARNKINDAIKELNDAGTADSLALLNADGNIDINNLPSKLLTTDDKGVSEGVASLDVNAKVPATQLPNSILEYKGTWNADTNDPTLSDGDATNAGNVYRVSVAGTTDFGSGSISFKVGDYAIADENGTWEKADTTDAVSSINGLTGDVTLDTDNISEGTNNLYYKNERVDDRVSNLLKNAGNVTLNYDDANNVLNISVPNDLTDLSGHNVTELSDVSSAGSGAIITSSERTTINNALTSIPTLQEVTDANPNVLPSQNWGISGHQNVDTNGPQFLFNFLGEGRENFELQNGAKFGSYVTGNNRDNIGLAGYVHSGDADTQSDLAVLIDHNLNSTLYGNLQVEGTGDSYFQGNVGIGTTSPSVALDVSGSGAFTGSIAQGALSSDPADPPTNSNVKWQSDGTGSGDDGDYMMKITDSAGTTKTTTLVDFSAI